MDDAPPLPSPWLVRDTPHQSSLLFAVLFLSVNVLMCARIMALARALQVNVWDLRRHYIPVLSFERHTDTATDMVWADSNVSSLARSTWSSRAMCNGGGGETNRLISRVPYLIDLDL